MSRKKIFNERYKTDNTPWELERPDSNLINIIKTSNIQPCKTLEIGCGTGSNAVWLSQNKFKVTGVDFSSLAIEKARKKAVKYGVEVDFHISDFLKQKNSAPEFEFLFDRGCFHSFDNRKERKIFAKNAGMHLKEHGMWLSFIGNADDKPREQSLGPPMRSALEIITAVEPYFKIVSLISGKFDSNREKPALCWKCLMKKRRILKNG